MKLLRIFTSAIFLSLFLTISVSAQTQPQTQPARPAPIPIGFIFSPMFADEKEGIKRYVAAIDSLDREFATQTNELKTLSNRAATLNSEIENLQKNPAADRNEIFRKQDELERIKREGTYKQENLKAAVAKRERDVLEPIEEDIYKELRVYANQFGIKVVLDVSKLREALAVYSEDADLTKAFIASYNAKNPVTTPAKPAGRP